MTKRTRAKKPAELKVNKPYQLLLTESLYTKLGLAKGKGYNMQREIRKALEARLDEILVHA